MNQFIMFKNHTNNKIYTIALEQKGFVLMESRSKEVVPVKVEDIFKILNGVAKKTIKIIGSGIYGKPVAQF